MDNSTLQECSQCGTEKEYTTEYFPKRTNPIGLRKVCKDCWNAKVRSYNKRTKPKKLKVCGICNKDFIVNKDRRTYCSDECKKEHERRQALKYYHEHLSAEVLNDYVTKECKHCGEFFETNTFSNVRLFCNDICANKYKKDKYRNSSKKVADQRRRDERLKSARVAAVNREDIFKRDKYICQLCEEDIDMSLVVPHPLSATIDHIIPIAKGGTHEPSNVQLAHFMCNCKKSDKILNQKNDIDF